MSFFYSIGHFSEEKDYCEYYRRTVYVNKQQYDNIVNQKGYEGSEEILQFLEETGRKYITSNDDYVRLSFDPEDSYEEYEVGCNTITNHDEFVTPLTLHINLYFPR